MTELTRRLRELRKSAVPSISGEEMAEKLGLGSRQAYLHYESDRGFKGRFLTLQLAKSIAAILADHGVNPDDVMALAGLDTSESPVDTLTAGESQLLDRFRDMTPRQRRLLLQLVDQFGSHSEVPKSATGATLHSSSLSLHAEHA